MLKPEDKTRYKYLPKKGEYFYPTESRLLAEPRLLAESRNLSAQLLRCFARIAEGRPEVSRKPPRRVVGFVVVGAQVHRRVPHLAAGAEGLGRVLQIEVRNYDATGIA